MLNKIPEPWKSFLIEIDAVLEHGTHFHCIGGFVIAMLYNLKRETSDLDFISCIPRENDLRFYELASEGSKLHKKYGVYLDSVKIATVLESGHREKPFGSERNPKDNSGSEKSADSQFIQFEVSFSEPQLNPAPSHETEKEVSKNKDREKSYGTIMSR